jgi:phosphocarrier protein HPr
MSCVTTGILRNRRRQVLFTGGPVFLGRGRDFGLLVSVEMKIIVVTVPWKEGIHLRRAGRIAQLAARFRASIVCRLGDQVADARSVISILILCASLGATLEIEASGPDEREAIQAVDAFFSSSEDSKSREDI